MITQTHLQEGRGGHDATAHSREWCHGGAQYFDQKAKGNNIEASRRDDFFANRIVAEALLCCL